MKIGYSDFVLLCKVNDPDTWCGWLSVRADGVYVKVPDEALNLTAHERAVLTEHPTGNLSEPALRFPCVLKELQRFLETQGVTGCIDPFDMADWILEKTGVIEKLPASNPNVSERLSLLNQASAKFWANASRQDRGSHPTSPEVTKWLLGRGFPSSLAPKGSTIIRPEWAPRGRKPDE